MNAARAPVRLAAGVLPVVGFALVGAHDIGSMRSSPWSALSGSLPQSLTHSVVLMTDTQSQTCLHCGAPIIQFQFPTGPEWWHLPDPAVLSSKAVHRRCASGVGYAEPVVAASDTEPGVRVNRDDDGTVNEFFARDVRQVHFKALDQSQWHITLELANGDIWQAHFGASHPEAKGYAFIERRIFPSGSDA
jgi:hypothetical protein